MAEPADEMHVSLTDCRGRNHDGENSHEYSSPVVSAPPESPKSLGHELLGSLVPLKLPDCKSLVKSSDSFGGPDSLRHLEWLHLKTDTKNLYRGLTVESSDSKAKIQEIKAKVQDKFNYNGNCNVKIGIIPESEVMPSLASILMYAREKLPEILPKLINLIRTLVLDRNLPQQPKAPYCVNYAFPSLKVEISDSKAKIQEIKAKIQDKFNYNGNCKVKIGIIPDHGGEFKVLQDPIFQNFGGKSSKTVSDLDATSSNKN